MKFNLGFSVLFVGLLSILFSAIPSFGASNCQQKQGALDIGSGATKAYAALVDVCKKQILEMIYEDQRPVPFNEALEKSPHGVIPPEMLDEATAKIAPLVRAMREKNVTSISAIATSAFRVAKNGKSFADSLSKRLEIPVQVITQDQEAEVGYHSALAAQKIPVDDKKSVIVWDIGGGSMQMLSRASGRTQIFKGDLASVTFKNKVIHEIQKRDPKVTVSPNPIGEDRDRATDLATRHAQSNVPPFFKEKAPVSRWIAIGGVLAISVQDQVKSGAHGFTSDELQFALKTRSLLTDSEIPSEYRTTDVTNLALVLGYMKGLGIKAVETTKASLAQGWLLFRMTNPTTL